MAITVPSDLKMVNCKKSPFQQRAGTGWERRGNSFLQETFAFFLDFLVRPSPYV